jgi:xylulokinase
MTLLLGIDQGAGSVKATVVDAASGSTVSEGSASLVTHTPQSGWAEQDPSDWRTAAIAAVRASLRGVDAAQIAAVSFSAGAHIGVLTDAVGQPLRRALLWSDSRASAEAAELRDGFDARILELTLNRANPTWLLPQLMWLRRHEPDVVAGAARLYIAKDWLRAQFTGTWETDYSDVLGALMSDVATKAWSPELAAHADWPMATLPPVVAATAVVGGVQAEMAAATGLRVGTPVVCGSNDTTVELFGCGALKAGDGAVKLATAGVTYQVTSGPLVRPPISCYPHIIDGLYYTATGTNSCASAHRWARDLAFAEGGFDEMDRLAGEAPAGSDGLLFHPYLLGERAPHWDPQLRASWTGMTMRHGRAHLARSVYEGIALSIRDALTTAETLGMRYDSIRLIGGGARSTTWRQIMADVLNKPVLVPANGDASFGAALVAGVGVGLFESPRQAIDQCARLVGDHTPDPATTGRYDDLFDVYRSIQARLVEPNHQLHQLSEVM